MKVECAWCGADMGTKPPLDSKLVSHGMCKKCVKKQTAKLDRDEARLDKMIAARRLRK